MYLEFNTFESFITLLGQIMRLSQTERREIRVHGEEGQAAVVSRSEQVDSSRRSLAKATGDPDPASKMIGAADYFPVLRVAITSRLPFPQTRLDSEGRPQSDVDQMRYETWVSLSDQVPVGRTKEFAVLQDLAAAINKAREDLALQVIYSSERIRELFAQRAGRSGPTPC